ncbi:hypothetical protein [Haladaptatus halobius]|uniref:hypothetical protein n=1 Tax=Haladaptatus halobius TaxID=2884875 RepID=UPI001D09A46F|nr:hypothetical protein [Haladaptatus halobius]
MSTGSHRGTADPLKTFGISLDSLASVRRLRIRSWTILWLSFVSGRAGSTTRRLLVLPADVYEDVAEVFHAGIDQEVELGETNRAQRIAFLATALGFLGVAIVMFVVVSRNDERLFLVFVFSSMFGVFSLPFLRLALFD